jgi:glucuronate isomerase
MGVDLIILNDLFYKVTDHILGDASKTWVHQECSLVFKEHLTRITRQPATSVFDCG